MSTRRRRPFVRWALCITLGVLVGIGSALLVLLGGLRGAEDRVGAWSTSADRGSSDANAYVRATTAVQALFAMRSDQVIYYVATTDDEGQDLTEDCDYEIRGGALPARWWSVTVYDGAYLPRGGDERHSVDATDVQAEDPGAAWSVRLSAQEPEAGQWLSTRSADRPNLLLRLYEPDEGVIAEPSSIDPPTITRTGCR